MVGAGRFERPTPCAQGRPEVSGLNGINGLAPGFPCLGVPERMCRTNMHHNLHQPGPGKPQPLLCSWLPSMSQLLRSEKVLI